MSLRAAVRTDSAEIPARIGLSILYAITALALLGYATFGLHPGLLARFPSVAGFYSSSFAFFAQAHVWIAWIVMVMLLAIRTGARWVPAFAVLYVISLGSELLGTSVGLPFGEYRYTEALGAKWLGHVPVVIPLSWFYMGLASYALVVGQGPLTTGTRVLLASLLLLVWDLALDPAMSRATAYWVWAEPGTYYGMPWMNLFGWYVTGLLLMTALALMRVEGWLRRVPLRWMAAFYGANLLLPIGMSLAAGLWGAVAITAVALALVGYMGTLLASRNEEISASARVTA